VRNWEASLFSENRLEPGLRFHPALDGGAEPLGPGIGQMNLPTPAIGASLYDGYEPITLERL
jgi:hypothetical protein